MAFLRSFLNYIGGSIGRIATGAVLLGLFFVLFGATPWEFAAELITSPPEWLYSGAFRLAAIILGLALIGLSLHFNRWSKHQETIDELAEDISWVISNILNRKIENVEEDVSALEKDFNEWCNKESKKLENRAFFTRADQLHFDSLGFVESVALIGEAPYDRIMSELKLKIERLRDIINWSQQRRR